MGVQPGGGAPGGAITRQKWRRQLVVPGGPIGILRVAQIVDAIEKEEIREACEEFWNTVRCAAV